MRLLAKRPTVLMWVTGLALLAARVSHHHGGRGFHNW